MTRNDIISSVKDGVAATNGSAWSIFDNPEAFAALVVEAGEIEALTPETVSEEEWNYLCSLLDLDGDKVARLFVARNYGERVMVFADENDYEI